MEKVKYNLEERTGTDSDGLEILGRDIWGEYIIILDSSEKSLKDFCSPEVMYRLVEYHEETGLADVEKVIEDKDRGKYAAEFYLTLIREAGL